MSRYVLLRAAEISIPGESPSTGDSLCGFRRRSAALHGSPSDPRRCFPNLQAAQRPHFYVLMYACPSVCPSVRPSVHPACVCWCVLSFHRCIELTRKVSVHVCINWYSLCVPVVAVCLPCAGCAYLRLQVSSLEYLFHEPGLPVMPSSPLSMALYETFACLSPGRQAVISANRCRS